MLSKQQLPESLLDSDRNNENSDVRSKVFMMVKIHISFTPHTKSSQHPLDKEAGWITKLVWTWW
jgi:hypothetical protein